MAKKSIRIDVTSEQFANLRQEVFCNPRLSVEQRRRAIRKVMQLPTDGSRVDFYCDGNFVGTV